MQQSFTVYGDIRSGNFYKVKLPASPLPASCASTSACQANVAEFSAA